MYHNAVRGGLVFTKFFVPSVLWRCWLGKWKGIQPVKVVGCWHGCLGVRCTHTHTHTHRAVLDFVREYPGQPTPERSNEIYCCKRQWVVEASAGHMYPTTPFLQAGCPSCRPTNSIKELKVRCRFISFNFLVLAHPGGPGQRVVKWVLLLFSV